MKRAVYAKWFGYILIQALVLIIIILLISNYKMNQRIKWSKFNKCIESHPSDLVCDSCYFLIFGKH